MNLRDLAEVRWFAAVLLVACSGTGASPSQPIDSTPPPPAAITPVGVWNDVASASELSCAQATVSVVKSDSIINYNIPGPGIPVAAAGSTGLSGSTAGCMTLSPLAAAPLTTVRGSFYSNEVLLFLFHQGDPPAWYGAQMIWLGTQSDANHMSGNVYSTPAGSGYALGAPLGLGRGFLTGSVKRAEEYPGGQLSSE
jgi:hypothetical protein